jgi:hypothetical protein
MKKKQIVMRGKKNRADGEKWILEVEVCIGL